MYFCHTANSLYIDCKELDQVYKQLAAFKRGKLNIMGVEGPANERVIGEVGGEV